MPLRTLRRAAFAAGLALAAAPAVGQTLTDTLIAAYRTSGLLDQNRAALRAADEGVAQAMAALRPVIEYTATTSSISGATSVDATELELSAEMLLWDFGGSRLAIDAQKEAVLATREALRSVEQDVLLRAVAAHLNVRLQTAFVGLRDNNVRVIQEQLRAARDRFEVGEVTRTDVSIAEARLAAARSAFAAAQGALSQAREEYRAVTDAYPGRLAALPRAPSTAATLSAARSVAMNRHPDIAQAQRQVTVSELRIAIAEKQLLPDLVGSATLEVDDDGNDTETLAVQLTGPIYRGGALASGVREAQADRDRARASLYTATQSVDQDVGNAWADLAVARVSVQASEEGVRAARLALRGAQEELDVGSRTVLDVLDREQELLDAQTTLISSQTDLDLAVYQLLAAMGLMSAEHLGLGIATYDPAAYYNAVKSGPTVEVSPQGERLDRVLKRLGRN